METTSTIGSTPDDGSVTVTAKSTVTASYASAQSSAMPPSTGVQTSASTADGSSIDGSSAGGSSAGGSSAGASSTGTSSRGASPCGTSPAKATGPENATAALRPATASPRIATDIHARTRTTLTAAPDRPRKP